MPTTEPQTNQAIVNAIVLKLGALRKQPCPGYDSPDGELECEAGYIECGFEEYHYPGGYCHYCGPNQGKGLKHGLCHGTGTITDPSYQAAGEMLWPLASHLVVGGVPSAYTKHPVVDWPDCAVVGLLEGVVRAIHDPRIYAFLFNWKRGDNPVPKEYAGKWFQDSLLPFHWPDPDDAQGLGRALMEALNGHS